MAITERSLAVGTVGNRRALAKNSEPNTAVRKRRSASQLCDYAIQRRISHKTYSRSQLFSHTSFPQRTLPRAKAPLSPSAVQAVVVPSTVIFNHGQKSP